MTDIIKKKINRQGIITCDIPFSVMASAILSDDHKTVESGDRGVQYKKDDIMIVAFETDCRNHPLIIITQSGMTWASKHWVRIFEDDDV